MENINYKEDILKAQTIRLCDIFAIGPALIIIGLLIKTKIMSNYREKITDIIIDKLGVNIDEITEEKTFGDLGADSLDAVELIMEFEKEFGINIPDVEMEEIKTVGDAMGIVIKKIGDKEVQPNKN